MEVVPGHVQVLEGHALLSKLLRGGGWQEHLVARAQYGNVGGGLACLLPPSPWGRVRVEIRCVDDRPANLGEGFQMGGT